MKTTTIVGACGLLVLLGVAVFLLAQIPLEFAIGGLLTLLAIFAAVAHDSPDDAPNAP